MALSVEDILGATSDEDLYGKLTAALNASLPLELHKDLDEFVNKLKDLSPGLRAMAATFQFDVSMCLDDLGWHFANWHHHPFCRETSEGLRVLGATEAAELFDQGYRLVLPHWNLILEMLARDFKEFVQWYNRSDLENSLNPLNKRLWAIPKASRGFGLMQFWLDYTRAVPDRAADHAG